MWTVIGCGFCALLGWVCALIGTTVFYDLMFREEIVDEIKKIVKEHLGSPFLLSNDVRRLEKYLAEEREACGMAIREIESLKEELNVWKEGVAKGFDTETIEEQVRWQGSGTRGDSTRQPGEPGRIGS